MEISALEKRVQELIEFASTRGSDPIARTNQVYQGTLTLLLAVYGPESYQIKTLQQVAEQTLLKYPINNHYAENLTTHIIGTLRNLKAEIDAGFIGSLQKRLTGEVLTDFIQLARAIVDDSGEKGKNVAAVLAAAAYEDTIRRMGAAFAGVIGRNDLDDVIEALKKASVLQSPQLGIAVSYLKFRNDALHANWEKIQLPSVHSVLAFVEQLLLKHFG